MALNRCKVQVGCNMPDGSSLLQVSQMLHFTRVWTGCCVKTHAKCKARQILQCSLVLEGCSDPLGNMQPTSPPSGGGITFA